MNGKSVLYFSFNGFAKKTELNHGSKERFLLLLDYQLFNVLPGF